MDRLNGKARGFLARAGIVLAAAGLLWGIIALFFPVASTELFGTLDTGRAYAETYTTSAYNTAGGYLVLLAAVVCLAAAVRQLKGTQKPLESLGWAVFPLVLLVANIFAGGTRIVTWLSFVPAEIQYALGSQYVKAVETNIANIPLYISEGFIAASIVAALGYAAFSYRKTRPGA